jgi:hypothetical protein
MSYTYIVDQIKNLHSIEQMKNILKSPYAQPQSSFKIGKKIQPLNKMDQGSYSYTLTAQYGDVYSENFQPHLTPDEMLKLGVFEGKYLNDCLLEFPLEWFQQALQTKALAPNKPDVSCNYFKIKSRMSLQNWIQNGWIPIIDGDPDNRGWFQWYCRYYIGRRIPHVDEKQIKRWRAFNRHFGQVKKNCSSKDFKCRPKQRQALLQWAYNPFI